MESQLTIRSVLDGMIPPKDEALRLLKIWGTIFAFLVVGTVLRSWDRGISDQVQYWALLATEAAIFTVIIDFTSLAMRERA